MSQISSKNSLWNKWMIVYSIIILFGGFSMAFIIPIVFSSNDPFLVEVTGLSTADIQPELTKYTHFIFGILGSTMMGWGVLLLMLSYRLLNNTEKWIWKAISISILVWYIPDTVISLMYGSFLNVILNTTLLVGAIPPLYANRNYIFSS